MNVRSLFFFARGVQTSASTKTPQISQGVRVAPHTYDSKLREERERKMQERIDALPPNSGYKDLPNSEKLSDIVREMELRNIPGYD